MYTATNRMTARDHSYAPKSIHTHCFAADTQVMTPHGPRPIQAFLENDRIITYDLDQSQLIETLVEKVDIHIGRHTLLEFRVGRRSSTWVTAGHRFFDGSDWMPCQDLRMVLTATGKIHSAYSLPTPRIAHAVYNLRTSTGTYLIGDEATLTSGGKVIDLSDQWSFYTLKGVNIPSPGQRPGFCKNIIEAL